MHSTALTVICTPVTQTFAVTWNNKTVLLQHIRC